MTNRTSDVTVRTLTPCVLLTLSRKELEAILKQTPSLGEAFKKATEAIPFTEERVDDPNLETGTEVVSQDPNYCTNYGKVHYMQYLVRDHSLVMRPGQQYRFSVSFEPDITLIEA